MHRPPGRYAKGVKRREQIIQAATRVFCEEGFQGATFKRVAELVGLREASLFYYFPGKQDLLGAVLARQDDIGGNRGNSSGGPGLELPRLVSIAARNTKTPGLAALLSVATAAANPPCHAAHGFFRDRYEALTAALREDLEHRQLKGEIRNDVSAATIARLLIAALEGLQLQWLYDKNVNVEAALEDLIQGLFPPLALTAA
jgi:AcrR family transcriptional regulator